MKKLFFISTICLFILTPLLVFSSSGLSERLRGKILLAVEDKGKTYYVHDDGNKYRITVATAQKIFEKLALGITNDNLNKIPLNDVGIEPEASVCPEVTCPVITCPKFECELCDYSEYQDQITDLEKEVTDLKIQNEELSDKVCDINANQEAEDALRKEYGLKINQLELENLEISDVERYRYYDLKNITFDSDFKNQIVVKMFNEVSSTSIHVVQLAYDFFNKEQQDRTDEIALLRNELEKKVLELQ